MSSGDAVGRPVALQTVRADRRCVSLIFDVIYVLLLALWQPPALPFSHLSHMPAISLPHMHMHTHSCTRHALFSALCRTGALMERLRSAGTGLNGAQVIGHTTARTRCEVRTPPPFPCVCEAPCVVIHTCNADKCMERAVAHTFNTRTRHPP